MSTHVATVCVILVIVPLVLSGASGENPCPDESTHRYGPGVGTTGRSMTLTGGEGLGAGFVHVTDTNAERDCDGDGVPGDFDGDYDSGSGGGFFGFGSWVDACDYNLNAHGGQVYVYDFVWAERVEYRVGENDQSGPVLVVDPEMGEMVCETDGSISPGDPAVDPTADPDDCLTPIQSGWGATCGSGGGDGGYWVFLEWNVRQQGAVVHPGYPPTIGIIVASEA